MPVLALVAALCCGLFLIGASLYGRMRGRPLYSQEDQLRRMLFRWRVFEQSNPTPELYTKVKLAWWYLRDITCLSGGIGVLLMVVIISVVSLVTTGRIDGNDIVDGFLFNFMLYSSFFIGLGVGGIYALRHLRKETQRHVTYADLRQRRLSDYRSGLFRLLPLIILIETLVSIVLFAPHLGSQLVLLTTDGNIVAIPNSPWLLGLVPAAIVLLTLIAEFLMARIAQLPRILVTSDATVSQRMDDLLRTTVIGLTLAYETVTLAALALVQNDVITRSLQASGYWFMSRRPFGSFVDLSMLAIELIMVSGFVTIAVNGRLGGKLSGWPWQQTHNLQRQTQPRMQEQEIRHQ